MAKKPKKEWQIAVRAKLDIMGIGYQELADRIGEKEGCVRQVMCKDNQPILKEKICRYLDVEIKEVE